MKKLQLILILVIAGILRFYNNTAVALWHDEAFSALYIGKYGWGEMMHRIILDVHPPLYYIVLRLWGYVFGHSLLSLRGFSIIFGILAVWAGYAFIKRAFKNENLAIFGALLLAINPFSIQYALEARMYTFGMFLTMLSCYLLVKALEESNKKTWFWYAVTVAAAAYTHYFLLFSLAAQGLYFLYYCISANKSRFYKSKEFLYGLGAYVFSVILYIPWLPSFLEQNSRVQGGYWIGEPDRWSVPGTVWKMVFGGDGTGHRNLIIAALAALAIAVYFLRANRLRAKWLVFLSLVVPFVASIALSLKTAIYLDRYFIFASLFMVIILAGAIQAAPKLWIRRLLALVLVIVSVTAFFKNWQKMNVEDFSFKNFFTTSKNSKKPGMAGAAELINEQARQSDHIYVGSSFIFFTFQYYNQSPVKPLLLSDRYVEDIPHYAGTAILTNDDIQIIRDGLVPAEAVNKNDNIWLLWTTGFGGSKPNVPGNWSEVVTQEYPDTPDFKGSIYVTEYHVR